MFSIDPLSILFSTTPGRSDGMLQLSPEFIDESSELSRFERSVTAFGVCVDPFRRRNITEEKSAPGVTASELGRIDDFEGDLPLVNVNLRFSFLFLSVFSALFASSGLPV